MGLIVKDVYACTLKPGERAPEGCYLGADCSCGFADGTTMSYAEWSGINAKSANRKESSYFLIILVIVFLGIFAFKYVRRKLRAMQQI